MYSLNQDTIGRNRKGFISRYRKEEFYSVLRLTQWLNFPVSLLAQTEGNHERLSNTHYLGERGIYQFFKTAPALSRIN